MTSKRSLTIILLLFFMFFLQEMWQMNQLKFKIDAFLFYTDNEGGNSIYFSWFLHDLGDKLSKVVLSLILIKLSRLYFDVKVVAVAYLYYSILDLALFFICYNTCSYVLVYLSTMVFGVLYIYQKKHRLFNFNFITEWYYNGWKYDYYWYLPEHFADKVISELHKEQEDEWSVARND